MGSGSCILSRPCSLIIYVVGAVVVVVVVVGAVVVAVAVAVAFALRGLWRCRHLRPVSFTTTFNSISLSLKATGTECVPNFSMGAGSFKYSAGMSKRSC